MARPPPPPRRRAPRSFNCAALALLALRAAAEPVALVRPAEKHTRLEVAREGLEALRSIRKPVAPVVVIGPYRSGKSFLLNELLGVGCDQGFGVGHSRHAETKGAWAWRDPVLVHAGEGQGEGGDAPERAVVFVDTEGFESAGRADVYDDRVFALSTILASVLVYNLPETVRETDIEKLAFAAELAGEFYARASGGRGSQQATTAAAAQPLQPANLLWLIQRDFLRGSSVQQMVREALEDVPNPSGDKHVAEVNDVRASLRNLAGNSTAFGLAQPHLDRTRLCELGDAALDPPYVAQRDELRGLVRRLALPKRGADGRPLDGPGLAALLERSVAALNQGEFPSARAVVESFNKDVVQRCLDGVEAALAAVQLPAPEAVLDAAAGAALEDARRAYDRDRFGTRGTDPEALRRGAEKLRLARAQANELASARLCEELFTRCEARAQDTHAMRLPSTGKFDAALGECAREHDARCVGPSKGAYAAKMERLSARERSLFLQGYNRRLLNGLLGLAVALIAGGRLFARSPAVELAGWALFAVLEGYPKLHLGGEEALFESVWWRLAVRVWEAAVYNRLVDLDRWGPAALVAFGAATAAWRARAALVWVGRGLPLVRRLHVKKAAPEDKDATV